MKRKEIERRPLWGQFNGELTKKKRGRLDDITGCWSIKKGGRNATTEVKEIRQEFGKIPEQMKQKQRLLGKRKRGCGPVSRHCTKYRKKGGKETYRGGSCARNKLFTITRVRHSATSFRRQPRIKRAGKRKAGKKHATVEDAGEMRNAVRRAQG